MQGREILFTPSEAAVLTGLPLKTVNNAIDKKTVRTAAGPEGIRLLDARALVSLSLERRLADRIAPELRRQVSEVVTAATRKRVSLEDGLLQIDLREPRRELARSLRQLRRARQLAASDPEIFGGDPVFRGTRVPVHIIADLLQQGSTPAELLESYPRLTPEMIRLAPVYASAYPLRGRPRNRPWRGQEPVRRSRRLIDNASTS